VRHKNHYTHPRRLEALHSPNKARPETTLHEATGSCHEKEQVLVTTPTVPDPWNFRE